MDSTPVPRTRPLSRPATFSGAPSAVEEGTCKMADGERSQVVFVYASSAILCYAEARARAAYTHRAAMAFRAKTPSVLRPTARRTIERARSIATARPSRRSPSRVLWLSRTESRAMACPWHAHCQPGLAIADVDAEQDGRGVRAPSVLAGGGVAGPSWPSCYGAGSVLERGQASGGRPHAVRSMCSG